MFPCNTTALCLSVALLIGGCATAIPRSAPLPKALSNSVTLTDIPYARHWADAPPLNADAWATASDERLRQRYGGIMDREHAYLAISGGGDNGAFGAGLLMGWTQAGNRPEFTMVTGISTGGLIAPFAFLGKKYDETLKEIFTSYSTKDLLVERSLFNAFNNDAAADTAPLRAMISRYVDQRLLSEIAVEARKGRTLYIGTTNIDAARPVMWDIGRIALSNAPGSLQLVRDIMLASSSIPGAFPPVIFNVEADGKPYQELHVDGGVTSQVFLFPQGLDWRLMSRRLNVQGKPNVYVIRNAFLSSGWETVDRKIVPLVGRTIASLIRTQGIGDLYRIYLSAQRDGQEFNLAAIPEDVEYSAKEIFDKQYMSSLFERARSTAIAGYPWAKTPPGFTPAELGR